ncbi:hypothetical protein MPH_11860 [Macrophomina phaseolina MS6]|uniref:Uncharacterized protein n=1 Tax=Macrophomina phaseolina (strain MS6) TaxID=1126212 RepID=K2R8W5_MACPH|nr:hypothetical protein MPH_11860 [Macrophomina phaseolina MS6]
MRYSTVSRISDYSCSYCNIVLEAIICTLLLLAGMAVPLERDSSKLVITSAGIPHPNWDSNTGSYPAHFKVEIDQLMGMMRLSHVYEPSHNLLAWAFHNTE